MILIFNGMESPDHRRTLLSIQDMFTVETPPPLVGCISYRSLRSRRLGAAYVKETAEKMAVVLESGAATADLTEEDAKRLRGDYYTFATELEEVVSFFQFEHSSSDVMTDELPLDDRLIPVLSPAAETILVPALLEKYGSVAMRYRDEKRLPAILRKHATDASLVVALHHSDLAEAQAAGFNTTTLSAWYGPGQRGEPVVWDGHRAVRRKAKSKPDILKNTRWLDESGFDIDLLERDDAREWNRVAVLSYLTWAAELTPDVSEPDTEPSSAIAAPVSGGSAVSTVNTPREPTMLPVFDVSVSEVADPRFGTVHESVTLTSSQDTLRTCDTCFLSATCPQSKPGATCAYNLPVAIRTEAQAKALMYTMVEIQANRVAFARFAEEVNGGYPDPVVGMEMDRLVKMTEKVLRPTGHKERLTVSVESEGTGGFSGGGVLSSIFGARPEAQAPQPIKVIESDQVVEGFTQ